MVRWRTGVKKLTPSVVITSRTLVGWDSLVTRQCNGSWKLKSIFSHIKIWVENRIFGKSESFTLKLKSESFFYHPSVGDNKLSLDASRSGSNLLQKTSFWPIFKFAKTRFQIKVSNLGKSHQICPKRPEIVHQPRNYRTRSIGREDSWNFEVQ